MDWALGERRGRRNQGAKGSPLSNGPQCLLHTERPAVQQMCLSLSAPEPFHPSSASPPPPGPTRPPAPVCERGAPPRLGFELSAVTNPEICRGDPQKVFSPGCGLVRFIYNCPSERCHLGGGDVATWAGWGRDRKQTGEKSAKPLSPFKTL